jgi:putative ABC transport system permease protein
VIRDGAVMLSFGLLLGLVGAAALRCAIENHLYGVSPLDPRVLVLVVLLMSAATFAACLIPARRATRVDPTAALGEPIESGTSSRGVGARPARSRRGSFGWRKRL